MADRVVLITGGNAGIGRETAVGLARLGMHVVFTSRDARGAEALADIRERSGSGDVELMALDLADFASIHDLASRFTARFAQLDVLVNNAGLVTSRRTETRDGFETTFGVNHLGHFLLTALLLDRIRASAPSRVVVVASQAHRMARGLDFDDLQSIRRFRGFNVYAKSKLANIAFARALSRRVTGSGVTVNALHPGYVDSRFGRDGDVSYEPFVRLSAGLFGISPERGAATSVFCAADPSLEGRTGGYYVRSKPGRPSRAAVDDVLGERLWAASEALVASV